ncbi:hypothetical protein [Nitrosomonas mobilis]|uniref:hypothetical protein n=1 Tax=Nitrosomonas mobilis TaxID=51642 RepID=UPI0015A181EB|nr:hypothetical protein [Nitrosomonas mobilis]
MASSRVLVGLTQQLFLQILQLFAGEPDATIRARVQCGNGAIEHFRQQSLAKTGALVFGRAGGNILALIDNLPAQRL